MSTADGVRFRSDVTVQLVDSMGDDKRICRAARVERPHGYASIREAMADQYPNQRDKGLLAMLMRDRHGSPFEKVVFEFYIECPLFVAREFMRHRVASYNEESARYKELGPVFYVPAAERNLRQEGKPGAYTFTPGSYQQQRLVQSTIERNSQRAYKEYRVMLDAGIAREVARDVLPVNIYTSFYCTMNLRSLFNFLSLRRVTEQTTVPTFPLAEIQMVAGKMEAFAEQVAPEAMRLFNEHGRISP